MLQKIRDKISGWFAAVFLGAIAVVFIFWGIRFESAATASAAKVNGQRIPLETVRKAWQDRQTQLQQMLRDELPEELVKSEQQGMLDDFIRRELLRQQAVKLGYRVSDRKLAETLYAVDALKVDGKFSRDRYAAMLRQQGRTETQFELQLREELEVDELRNGIAVSAFATFGELGRRIALEGEERDVDHATFATAAFLAKSVVTPEQVAAWYDEHKAQYMTPESVDLQYVDLALADVAATIQVNDDALQKHYDEVAVERYSVAEQRRARHILVETGTDAAVARSRAESLLARVKAGEDFGKLAAADSDDAGSKGQGGELGWAGREAYVKPFADALFALQPGAISDLVSTEFGYHIIQLEEVRPASQRSFDDVRAELEADYRREQAQAAFYDQSQQLADESFAALTELDTVATKLGLPLKSVKGFTRSGGGPFADEQQVIAAVFSPDVLDRRQNSQPVSLGDDRVVVLRVVDHQLPQQRSLDAVRMEIDSALKLDAARDAARSAAQALAEQVRSGTSWSDAVSQAGLKPAGRATLRRNDTGLSSEIVKAAFAVPRSDTSHAVVTTAALANGDTAVVIVEGVRPGRMPMGADSAPQLAQSMQQAAGRLALAEFSAYVGELLGEAKITRNDNVFD